MRRLVRSRGLDLLLLIVIVAFGSCPAAESKDRISGSYSCAPTCRTTDVYPSVEIRGDAAFCMNEFGGGYNGRRLTDDRIYCFNKTGALSKDGTILRWEDGVVWKRLPARPSD